MIRIHKKFEGQVVPPQNETDRQHEWYNLYRIDSVKMGRMCEQYPALQKSWNEFKLVYELCRSQYDADRQNPELVR